MEQKFDDAYQGDMLLTELLELEQELHFLLCSKGAGRSEQQPYADIGEAVQHLQAAHEILCELR